MNSTGIYHHISMIHHDSPIESSQKMGRYASISQVYPKSGHYLVIIPLYPHDIPTIYPLYPWSCCGRGGGSLAP